jgi:hypothetical protein
VIQGEDRAEDIAYYYYGSVEYTWLVWLSARTLDPYYEWVMSYENFLRYLQKKYQTESGTTGTAVVDWCQNTQITDNVVEYRNVLNNDLVIGKDSYDLGITLGTLDGDEWTVWRVYDYEEEINEDRRHITLLDKAHAFQARSELEALLR